MRLISIAAQNLKGQTFALDLEPITMLIGPNDAGKTARMQAIKLALLGYEPDPEFGATNAATFRLASGNPMAVEACWKDPTWEPARSCRRVWTERNGSVSVKMTGDDPAVPPILLSASEYFGMSQQKRTDYIFGMAKIGSRFTVQTMAASVRGIRLDISSTATEAAIGSLMGELSTLKRPTVQAWLADAILTAKRLAKESRDYSVALSKSIAASVAADTGPVTDSPIALNENLEAVQQEAQRLAGEIAGITKQLEADDRLKKRRASAVTAAKTAESFLATVLIDPSEQILKLQSEIRTIQDAVMGYVHQAPPIQDKIERLKYAIEESRTRQNGITGSIIAAEIRRDAPSKKIVCPACTHEFQPDASQRAADFKAIALELDQKMVRELELVDKCKADIFELQGSLQLADQADGAMTVERQKLPALERKLEHATKLQQQIKAAHDTVREARAFDASGAVLLSHQVAGMEDQRMTMEEQAGELKLKATDLRERLNVAISKERDQVRIKEQSAEMLAADQAGAVYKEATTILLGHQAAMVQTAFGEILARANVLAAPILKTKLEFRDGEVGRTQDGQWISNKAFGGTAQAVTFLAIQVALSQDSPIRMVLFDEMTRLDDENKQKFLLVVQDAIKAGLLDGFVGVDTNRGAYDMNDVTIVEV